MQVEGAPSSLFNGLYYVHGTMCNLPIFKKRDDGSLFFFVFFPFFSLTKQTNKTDVYLSSCPERKWIFSRSAEGRLSDAIFESEETEKKMPSCSLSWKNLEHEHWVMVEEMSVRDCVVCAFSACAEGDNSFFFSHFFLCEDSHSVSYSQPSTPPTTTH